MKIFLESINYFLQRDLDKTIQEIEAYELEADLWKIAEGINNSAGNLSLHICGSINYYVGVILGNTGYQRDRDREFSDKDVPKNELVNKLKETKATISPILENLTQDDLEKDYPIQLWKGQNYTTLQMLMHLSIHLGYHLGQINYHRRLLT